MTLNSHTLKSMELLGLKLLDEVFGEHPFMQGYNSYNPPAYRVEYYMTQKDYSRVMSVLGVMWTPSDNNGHFTFCKGRLNTSLVGHCIRVKINA